jgi:hypothetical protein
MCANPQNQHQNPDERIGWLKPMTFGKQRLYLVVYFLQQ